jgi:hypothetical protein
VAKEIEFPELIHVAIRAETKARIDQVRGLIPVSIMVRRILDDWFVQHGYSPLETPLPQYRPQPAPMPSPFTNGVPHVGSR